jgi:hypothetical protein
VIGRLAAALLALVVAAPATTTSRPAAVDVVVAGRLERADGSPGRGLRVTLTPVPSSGSLLFGAVAFTLTAGLSALSCLGDHPVTPACPGTRSRATTTGDDGA